MQQGRAEDAPEFCPSQALPFPGRPESTAGDFREYGRDGQPIHRKRSTATPCRVTTLGGHFGWPELTRTYLLCHSPRTPARRVVREIAASFLYGRSLERETPKLWR
jgi:hypothetical protein